MLRTLTDYFNLRIYEDDDAEPVLGYNKTGIRNKQSRGAWTLGLYACVILGVISKQLLDIDLNFNTKHLISSIIISTVVFPCIYRQSNMNKKKPNIIHLFVAFQNGFFWKNILEYAGDISGFK